LVKRCLSPHASKRRSLVGYIAEGYWTDVGTIDEYMRACGDYMSGKVQLPRVGEHIGGGIWIDGDADIAPDARLHGPIFLGTEPRSKAA